MPDVADLLSVNELDLQLFRLREEAAAIPRAVAKIQARVKGEERERDALRAAGEAAVKERRQKERRVEELEAERRRFEKQLLEVKKNEEYSALVREIEARKAAKEAEESAVLALMLAEDARARELKAVEAVLARERDTAGKEIEARRGDLAAKEAEIARAETEREKRAAVVRPELRMRYERILGARGSAALADVKGGACSACYYQIPPQALTRLKRQEGGGACDGGGRLIA